MHLQAVQDSTATSLLDRVWIVFRDPTYNSQSPPLTIEGYKIQGGFVAPTTGTNATIAVGLGQFDTGSTPFDGNEERYNSKYFNFAEPCVYYPAGTGPYGGAKFQLNINGMFTRILMQLYLCGMELLAIPYKPIQNIHE